MLTDPRTGEETIRIGIVSVIVPVYNEVATIGDLLRKLQATPYQTQIIVVDDGSSDGTTELLQKEAAANSIELIVHPVNRGKGAAMRTGFARATGDIVIVQDADLEYDPADFPVLLAPIAEGRSQVVYGSRFLGPHGAMYFWHAFGNKLLTWTCNILFRTSLTDMETGYKVMTAQAAGSFQLHSERWGFDPEITAKLLKGGYSILEVPISYAGREFKDGKKISWKDGLAVAATLVRYRFFK